MIIEERREKREGKKIQYQQNHHDSSHTRCLIEFVSIFQMTWQPEIFGYYEMHLKKHQSINNRKLYGTKENK
jgi:hypothetical protein